MAPQKKTSKPRKKTSRKKKPGKKIFSSIPKYGRKRIFGTENEYGTIGCNFDLPDGDSDEDGFIPNGGRIYDDNGHVEYASPETSNPLEALIYEKAGELLSLPYAKKLYKNTVGINDDYWDYCPDEENDPQKAYTTFGAHENYFTKANFIKLKKIIPFLVTRQIFAGSGWLKDNGEFEISQKSAFISYAISDLTTKDRGILCTKNENLSNISHWHRLHLILGDANMCEIADFLKLGTTSLVLDLTEDDFLPQFGYNLNHAVSDLKNISQQTANWKVKGTYRPTKATDIQRKYLKAATKRYSGRDEVTDELLARWDNVLQALDENPNQLIGTLDWVTKKALIEAYAERNKLKITDPKLRNIDLQYHDLDHKTSLFYQLQKKGKIERLVTDNLIKKAAQHPPQDTRAKLRGYLIKKSKEIPTCKVYTEWDAFTIYGRYDVLFDDQIMDPFQTYDDLRKKLQNEFRKVKRK